MSHHSTTLASPPSQRLTPRQWLVLIALLLVGVILRGCNLGGVPIWVDEAESAVNALTIQQHGVPVDQYLGLPIFENVLTEPWPGHPEYEFRDSSYSKRGVAIYHGWLPLYSIAASQRLFGVRPDEDPTARTMQHDDAAIQRRIVAARVPAVVFGVLFLVLLFSTGREMYGPDAGWAALFFGVFAEPLVMAGRQARYYSPTLAFSVACCWFTWRIYKRGRLRDFVIGGLAFGALFHTHILSFVILCSAFVMILPWVLQRPGWFRRLLGMGAATTAMVLPWVILTGFLDQTSHVPPARTLLSFPADLLRMPLHRAEFTLIGVLSLIWVTLVAVLRGRLPARFRHPIEGHSFAFVFLIAWAGLALVAFTLLVPAASYFFKRLSLSVMGPGVLMTAIFVSAAARAISPRHSTFIAAIGAMLMLTVGRMLPIDWPYTRTDVNPQQELLAHLREQSFSPDTKLYVTPNDHLTLQYLTGMPFQSVAPIRKSFIDQWPGEVVVVEPVIRFQPITVGAIQTTAREIAGIELSEREALAWKRHLDAALTRREVAHRVAEVREPLRPMPDWATRLLDDQKSLTKRLIAGGHSPVRENAAVFRGQTIRDWSEWWPVFFYRFVDWPARAQENLNYAERARSARADVLAFSAYVVLRCPPRSPTTNPVTSTSVEWESSR